MRLKYQLRGLGIGIILTAALLMIFSDDGEVSAKADDAVVIASTEAEMTEDTAETENVSAVQEEVTTQEEISTVVEEGTSVEEESNLRKEIEKSSVEEQTTEIEVEEESVSETTQETFVEESKESEELPDNADDVVKIKIVSGDDSGTVARKLQTAGLVDNASEFDAYLMQHGYDKKIAVGEKEIPMDATWLEIAEKISSR